VVFVLLLGRHSQDRINNGRHDDFLAQRRRSTKGGCGTRRGAFERRVQMAVESARGRRKAEVVPIGANTKARRTLRTAERSRQQFVFALSLLEVGSCPMAPDFLWQSSERITPNAGRRIMLREA